MERKIIYLPENCKDPLNHSRRVYFSCCKEDFCKFDSINAQLSAVIDDFVIAYSEGEELGENFVSELENFHLFVIPITKNWFMGGVHQKEFDIIKQQKKAVLPILYDDSLEGEFNIRTGNMQFLRISDSEYDEKLQRALKDMLFDAALLSKVESVFTHKMFVAYCREDLLQTRRLVRLLHEAESCKQIAVWYDKYLPTGKDFRAELDKELNKCDIFGVTLTPALLDGDNYVKRIEYPFAVDNDKKIVFFELQRTDREKLTEGWAKADKQDYVSAEKTSQVSAYLKKLTKQIKGNTVHLSRPETDYLLGLAYLNGLFVEFDFSFAKQKFESAANAGISEAAGELAKMYCRGIGVERNMPRAVNFYKKQARLVREKAVADIKVLLSYEKMPLYDNKRIEFANGIMNDTAKSVLNAATVMHQNARKLRDEGFWKEAEMLYRELLDFLNFARGQVQYIKVIKHFYFEIVNELNMLKLHRGLANPEECKSVWEENLKDYKSGVVRCSTVLESARVYSLILMQRNEFSSAREVTSKALECAKDNPEDNQVLESVAVLERDMARALLYDETVEERVIKALEFLEKSREKFEKIGDKNEYNPVVLAWNHLHMGEAFAAADRRDLAYAMYKVTYEETNKFETDLDNVASELDYPIVLLQLYTAIVEKIINNGVGERDWLYSAFQPVFERFSKKEWNPDHKNKAAIMLKKLEIFLGRIGEN